MRCFTITMMPKEVNEVCYGLVGSVRGVFASSALSRKRLVVVVDAQTGQRMHRRRGRFLGVRHKLKGKSCSARELVSSSWRGRGKWKFSIDFANE